TILCCNDSANSNRVGEILVEPICLFQTQIGTFVTRVKTNDILIALDGLIDIALRKSEVRLHYFRARSLTFLLASSRQFERFGEPTNRPAFRHIRTVIERIDDVPAIWRNRTLKLFFSRLPIPVPRERPRAQLVMHSREIGIQLLCYLEILELIFECFCRRFNAVEGLRGPCRCCLAVGQ